MEKNLKNYLLEPLEIIFKPKIFFSRVPKEVGYFDSIVRIVI